ncbi:MAG: class I SAM-dependent methyltransferase [Chloroflexi bacterium]|nr:class I SAM-dependent methyltransferase [Chloroflexota bacterium]
MEWLDIIEVNGLFSPMYPFVAAQVIEAFGRDSGKGQPSQGYDPASDKEFAHWAPEEGCAAADEYAGGVSVELARRHAGLRITLGDDFPGIVPYFEDLVRTAMLQDRIEVRPIKKTELPFADGSFDLVVFRGGLFFWEERVPIVKEAYRVLAAGGLAMVGGGFGAGAPDSLIDSVAGQSRELNRKLGKKVLTRVELEETLREALVDGHSLIDERHGLWALIRKS